MNGMLLIRYQSVTHWNMLQKYFEKAYILYYFMDIMDYTNELVNCNPKY